MDVEINVGIKAPTRYHHVKDKIISIYTNFTVISYIEP